jgi:glutathione S-transferase
MAIATEAAAIALYLADRYSLGKLAPSPDDPARAAYLRWSLFSPSVIEPSVAAKGRGSQFKSSQVGWGPYESVVASMESAIAGRSYVLGERFSMADCIFGGAVRYLLRFNMLEPTPTFSAYAERLAGRPAAQRADARNAGIAKEHGLGG